MRKIHPVKQLDRFSIRLRCMSSSGMMKRRRKVVVGMSGGVDSSVAAYLLHQDPSLEVHGMYMNNWDVADERGSGTACPADAEFETVQQVCREIGIPCARVNFVKGYWHRVFEPCLAQFARGYTPNPDVLCHRNIKFDTFAAHAHALGADCIATGHYAQLQPKTWTSNHNDVSCGKRMMMMMTMMILLLLLLFLV